MQRDKQFYPHWLDVVVLAAAVACGNASGPKNQLSYAVVVRRCINGCTMNLDTLTSATTGDTASILLIVNNVATSGSQVITVRPQCRPYLDVMQRDVLVVSLPARVLCPTQLDTFALKSGEFYQQGFAWAVDAAVPRGALVLVGRMLVEPSMTAQAPITIR